MHGDLPCYKGPPHRQSFTTPGIQVIIYGLGTLSVCEAYLVDSRLEGAVYKQEATPHNKRSGSKAGAKESSEHKRQGRHALSVLRSHEKVAAKPDSIAWTGPVIFLWKAPFLQACSADDCKLGLSLSFFPDNLLRTRTNRFLISSATPTTQNKCAPSPNGRMFRRVTFYSGSERK